MKKTTQYLWLAVTVIVFGNLITLAGWVAKQDMLVPNIEAVKAKEVVREESLVEFVVRRFTEEGLSADKALRIIACESSFRPEIAIIEPNDTISFGLYQINSIHKDISHREKLDYKTATEWSIKKVKRDGDWSAWSCSRRLGIQGK